MASSTSDHVVVEPPFRHVNRCLDDRTMLNCTHARQGLGGVAAREPV